MFYWQTSTCTFLVSCLGNPYGFMTHPCTSSWASCQIPKIARTCAGNAGNVFPATAVSDPDIHHGTCREACRDRWLTVSFEIGDGEKRSRHSRCMRNPQLYVSGKRPMGPNVTQIPIYVQQEYSPIDVEKFRALWQLSAICRNLRVIRDQCNNPEHYG